MDTRLVKLLIGKDKSIYKDCIILCLVFYLVGYVFINSAVGLSFILDYGAPGRLIMLILMVFLAGKMWESIDADDVFLQPFTKKNRLICAVIAYFIQLVGVYIINLVVSISFIIVNEKIESGSIILKSKNVISIGYLFSSFFICLAMGTVIFGVIALFKEMAIRLGGIMSTIILVFAIAVMMVGLVIKNDVLLMLLSYFSGTCENVIVFILGSFLGGGAMIALAGYINVHNGETGKLMNGYALIVSVALLVSYMGIGLYSNAFALIMDSDNEEDCSECTVSEKVIDCTPNVNSYPKVVLETPMLLGVNVDYISLSEAKDRKLVDENYELEEKQAIVKAMVTKGDKSNIEYFKEVMDEVDYEDYSYGVVKMRVKTMAFNYGLAPKKSSNYSISNDYAMKIYLITSDDMEEE